MNFNEYQQIARSTAIYPNIDSNYVYPLLGLVNEAGEVAGKFKKLQRDAGGVITPEFRTAIAHELGDVLWYLSNTASEMGLSLDNIAQMNIDKLQSRKERGTLQGSGDNR